MKVISLHFSLLHCFSDTHESGMNISYVMEDKLEDKLEAQLEDLVNGQNLEDVIDITENAIVEDISEGINIDGVGISSKNGNDFFISMIRKKIQIQFFQIKQQKRKQISTIIMRLQQQNSFLIHLKSKLFPRI